MSAGIKRAGTVFKILILDISNSARKKYILTSNEELEYSVASLYLCSTRRLPPPHRRGSRRLIEGVLKLVYLVYMGWRE